MALTRITRDELEEFGRLDSERKQLEARARTLNKRVGELRKKFRACLEADERMQARRFGWGLALIRGRKTIKWKDAYIEELGAEAAADLEARTEAPLVLQITPPEEGQA